MRGQLTPGVSVILIVSALMVWAGCNEQKMDSRWAEKGITVDGKADDWSDLPITYFEDQKASIGLANDSGNFYILVRHRDPALARSIRMTGLTLWLNRKGNKDKYFTLRYRGGPTMEQMREAGLTPDSAGMPIERQFENQRRLDSGAILMCNIKDQIYDKPIPTDGEQGPEAAFAFQDGFFQYEFKVPLTKTQVRHYGLDAAGKSRVGLGAEWGGRPEFERRGGPPGDMMGGFPGGGEFPGGGGMRPPQGGRKPGGSRGETVKRQEIWLKVKLAAANAE